MLSHKTSVSTFLWAQATLKLKVWRRIAILRIAGNVLLERFHYYCRHTHRKQLAILSIAAVLTYRIACVLLLLFTISYNTTLMSRSLALAYTPTTNVDDYMSSLSLELRNCRVIPNNFLPRRHKHSLYVRIP